MTFGAPNAAARSIASRYCGSNTAWFSLWFMFSLSLPPPGHMVDCRPYFFSMGQSAGPTRSMPFRPRRAATAQTSSMVLPRPKHPRVAPCFKRPLRVTVWATTGVMRAAGATPAAEWRNDRRFMVIYRINIAGHK